jgi:UDP-glucose 4-epimerase
MQTKGAVMRYFITGGAGFIGSHIAEALVAKGAQVVILDDFSTGRIENVKHLDANGVADICIGSVTDVQLVSALMSECDCCLHLASAVGVKLVVSRPLETLRRNVLGTDIVISAAATQGKRLLYASTSEVYGKASMKELHEGCDAVLGSPFKSRWSYAIAKSYGEALAYAYHRQRRTPITVVRLFNTIGPRQRGAYGMVVPRLVRQALRGEDLTVYGDGTQSRCFLHVLDAVRAILALCEHDGSIGGVFNIGNPMPLTILELAQRIIERTASSSRIVLVPYEEAYDDGFEELGKRKPDTAAVRDLTGWTPVCTLDQALDDVIAFQREELAVHARHNRNGDSAKRPAGTALKDGVFGSMAAAAAATAAG